MHRPTGWNTWDFRGFNRLVFLRRGRIEIEILFAIWDERVPPPAPDSRQIGRLHDTFRWSDVKKLEAHAPLGLPAALEFAVGDAVYRVKARESGGTLKLSITPMNDNRHRVVFMLVAPIGRTPQITSPTVGTFAGWQLRFAGANWPRDYFLNIAEPYAVGRAGQAASVIISPIRKQPTRASASRSRLGASLAGGGALAEAPQAMMRAIAWNTLYDSRRGLVSSPVSRDWCYDWRGVLVFCWDTFLVGAMASYESPELARLNFETVAAAIDEIGHVPNYYMAHGAASLDRSMPPLGSYMIWKMQRPKPDRRWLAGIYPRLRRWHRYWMANRDGNGDGLLEWGTNPTPRYEFPQLLPYNPSLQHTAKCAMYESGLDNSPMFDDVPFNESANTLELADVALSSYFAMDCEALAQIAAALGRNRDAAAYRKEYERIARRINESLWDEEHGIYANRHWDGRFSRRWSPTSFFPLIAGVAPADRARRMIEQHLLNEKEFWGQWMIPSISRSDPAFPDNDYWRGRIWGPFNFLVAEGLRRYRFDDVAAQLARRSVDLFLKNLRKDGGIYENYNAVTGEGGDVWNAARLYHWGGLMALIGIQELVDVEPAGWLRFGSIDFPDCSVRNVRIGGHVFDVDLNRGVYVRRDGKHFLACGTRAIIRIPLQNPNAPVEILTRESDELLIRQQFGRAVVNSRITVEPTRFRSGVHYQWAVQ